MAHSAVTQLLSFLVYVAPHSLVPNIFDSQILSLHSAISITKDSCPAFELPCIVSRLEDPIDLAEQDLHRTDSEEGHIFIDNKQLNQLVELSL
jgi:hypothetical protein